MMRLFYFFILVFSFLTAGEKEERVLNKLIARKEIIHSTARSVGISPRIVASVIYAERLLNYNWDDAILDDVLAKSGYNSSIGFGQVKLNTAFWIEEELHNPAGKYYLGKEIASQFKRSSSRNELAEKLIKDSSNIYYAAAYIAMIKQSWKSVYLFRLENEAGILATLYSLGINVANGTERLPHPNPKMNDFGRTAQDFFDSFELRKEFP